MGLNITLVNGPRRSGKSMVASLLIDEVFDQRSYYVRLSAANGGKRRPVGVSPPGRPAAVAGAQWLCYDRERVFELLPELLASIHRRDPSATVVLEADADPVLRHAYPYDRQLFVMGAPHSLDAVFRSSVQAARALQDVLDDTAAFASEVFGLAHEDTCTDDDSWTERDLMTKSQIRTFLHSPLGDQLATQVQLRPEYHGLVESDLVLVNRATGALPAAVDGCCDRLERLLAHDAKVVNRDVPVFCCDPSDPRDPRRWDLLEAIRRLCHSASTPR